MARRWLSANLPRRHLAESQRAIVADKVATLSEGRPEKNRPIGRISQTEAATRLNVGVRTVKRARVVREKGMPELVHQVEQGKITVSVAEKAARLSPDEQREIAADPKNAKHAVKRHHLVRRETELADRTAAELQELGTKVYGVIYADPPWRVEPHSRETGMDRAAENHYQGPVNAAAGRATMRLGQIDDGRPRAGRAWVAGRSAFSTRVRRACNRRIASANGEPLETARHNRSASNTLAKALW